MASFIYDINLNSNDLLEFKYNPISTGDPVPTEEFGKLISYDGTGVFPEFTDGLGLYTCNTSLNWVRSLQSNDTSITATADTVANRDASGNFQVPLTATSSDDTVSLSQLNTFIANSMVLRGTFSQTGPSHYPKANAANAVGAIQIGSSLDSISVMRGDAWRVTGGGFLMGQPTGHMLEPGDIILAIVDMAGNNDSDWVVLSKNLVEATTTEMGVFTFAAGVDLLDRATASGVTDKVMTAERYAVNVHQGFTADTTDYGTFTHSEVADFNNRTTASANTIDVVPTSHLEVAMDNFTATTGDAGTILLAEAGDMVDKVTANLNNTDALTPNLVLQGFNNFNSTTTEYGTVRIAETSDMTSHTNLQANTDEMITPSLVIDAFNNVLATDTTWGTTIRYSSGDILNLSAAVNNDDDYMTPFGMYKLIENSDVLVHAKYTITGLSGTVTVTNTTIPDIKFIKFYDSTGGVAFLDTTNITQVGSDVNITFVSNLPSFNGSMSVIYLWS